MTTTTPNHSDNIEPANAAICKTCGGVGHHVPSMFDSQGIGNPKHRMLPQTNHSNNKKQCCDWHNHLPEMYDSDATPEDSFDECGLAGMGTPSVCCRNCPQAKWFIKHRGITPDYVKEIMALPRTERP